MKIKRIGLVFVILLSFFIISDKVLAAEFEKSNFKKVKLRSDETLASCESRGNKTGDCVYSCSIDYSATPDTMPDTLEAILANLNQTIPESATGIIADAVSEVKLGDHVFDLAPVNNLDSLKEAIRTYARTLPSGQYTLTVSYPDDPSDIITPQPAPPPAPTQQQSNCSIIRGDKQTYYPNWSNDNIVIVASGDPALVSSISVGQGTMNVLNQSQYSIKDDRNNTTETELTLKKSYLNGLDEKKEYNVRFTYTNGAYCDANLKIGRMVEVTNTIDLYNPDNDNTTSQSTTNQATYKCYSYFHPETISKPPYYTTVWTNQVPKCGFVLKNWSYEDCKDGTISHSVKVSLANASGESAGEIEIAHSGYNGVADFYDLSNRTEEETSCNNFGALHIVYRVITIVAPIIAILFITYDFVKCIVSGDPNKIAGFRKKAIRRIIALLILVLLPILVSTIVHTLSKNDKIATGSWIKCMITGEGVGTNISDTTTQSSTTTSAEKIADSNKTTNKTTNNTNKTTTNSNSTQSTTTNSNKTANNTNKTTNKTTQTTTTTTNSTSSNKAKRTAIANAAKEIKEYTRKNNFKWCARGNNKCQTKKVEDAISSNNKQKKISCATLANAALYKAGIYSASDINGHSINNSRSTATYLRDKGWTLITDSKKLEAGDIVFYYRPNKTLITIPGMSKAQSIGHVEVYAGNNKVYTSGSDKVLKQITTGFSSGSFRFAYRYPGN